jgi:hypothetical protein
MKDPSRSARAENPPIDSARADFSCAMDVYHLAGSPRLIGASVDPHE